jgi:hypothetical protein
MEAAADVVAHAALGHGDERRHHHVAPGVAPGVATIGARGDVPRAQQQEQLGRTRELRCSAEPAEAPVERARELIGGVGEGVEAGDRPRRLVVRAARLERREPLHHDVRRGQHLGPLLAPHAADLAQQVDEPGPAPAPGRREVGAAVERLQVRGQPDAHRPAALPRRRLDERHVDAVDVGPLLAVDLDRDAGLVQHRGHSRALERLPLHDVAPVARRVADRQEDRDVAAAGLGERLVAPRIPIHRVLRVLAQIRGGLDGKAVGHDEGAGRDERGARTASGSRFRQTGRESITRPRRSRPTGPPRDPPRCRARWHRPASFRRGSRGAAARRPP